MAHKGEGVGWRGWYLTVDLKKCNLCETLAQDRSEWRNKVHAANWDKALMMIMMMMMMMMMMQEDTAYHFWVYKLISSQEWLVTEAEGLKTDCSSGSDPVYQRAGILFLILTHQDVNSETDTGYDQWFYSFCLHLYRYHWPAFSHCLYYIYSTLFVVYMLLLGPRLAGSNPISWKPSLKK